MHQFLKRSFVVHIAKGIGRELFVEVIDPVGVFHGEMSVRKSAD
jgi:hypothetical protein